MTNPDAAESKAQQAANAMELQIVELWKAAHTDGIRNGLEVAATLADQTAKQLSDNYSIDAQIRAVSVHCLNEMRDIIRLTALQVPDPEDGN
ncbi:hypothetical protein ABQF35_14435 [Mycobacterium syngnathidarum]